MDFSSKVVESKWIEKRYMMQTVSRSDIEQGEFARIKRQWK